ncbi:SMI1/KNR4 family protein [Streptomyces sp. NRRL S-1868]|uniref:SMI1/KNR4 family protein n=1 Tax=Streptomyces sp. NRRL S-1868 TaxID=1463892 RepID=UPI0004CA60D3|nr:SMI1/KNR4 family protein [Streptomyces sp. NRRL S-1868]
MWREIVEQYGDESEVGPPATEEDLRLSEEELGTSMPSQLRELLMECDGVADAYGTDVIWDTRKIAQENIRFRTTSDFRDLYMPFDHLLFFGDNGGGDQFAFPASPAKADVYLWDHETDSRIWVAADLRQYVQRALEADGEDWYR